MPINYSDINYQTYDLDWKKLSTHIKRSPLFQTQAVTQLFCSRWIEKLKISEQFCVNNFSKTYVQTTEHYPIHLSLKEMSLGWIAINIDAVEKLIYQKQLCPTTLYLSEFISNEEFKKLTFPCKTKAKNIIYSVNSTISPFSLIPIIVFQSNNSNNSLVIDGNHRIDTLKKQKATTVNAYTLNEHFCKNFADDIFFDTFSRDLFIFWYEYYMFLEKNAKNKIFFTKTRELLTFKNCSIVYSKEKK